MNRADLEQRGIFVSDVDAWSEGLLHPKPIEDAQVIEYPDGVILPPIKDESVKSYNGVYFGGVVDCDGEWVAGRLRSLENDNANWNCRGGYEFENPAYRDETVVFGGVTFAHFGHALLDTTARLWALTDERYDDYKICFIDYGYGFRAPIDPFQFTDMMGIDRSRIEVIKEPTRFSSVLVPDEAIYPHSGEYRAQYIQTFDRIRDRNRRADTPRKIYFTKRQYKGSHCLNEEYFEQFYSRRGFEIVSPEKLPLSEQVALVAGADEFVSTVGTMTHLLLFAQPDIRATILNRSADCVLPQLCVDAVRGIQPYYVEAALNALPSRHTSGVHLLYPNRYFRRYLEFAGIPYEDSELKCDKSIQDATFDFLREWSRLYREPHRTNEIGNKSMEDVLRSVYAAVYDTDNVPEYPNARTLTNRIEKLEKSVEKLKQDNERLKQDVKVEREKRKEAERLSPLYVAKRKMKTAKKLLTK